MTHFRLLYVPRANDEPYSAYKTAHSSDADALLAERGRIDSSHRMTDDILASVALASCQSTLALTPTLDKLMKHGRNSDDSGRLWEESTPNFWKSVRLIGAVGPLVGESKYFFQAGYWDIVHPGLHIEMMLVKNIKGMYLEKDGLWRAG